MNRRGFIKTITVAGSFIPFLSFGTSTPDAKAELEDFFAFCEKQTVPMPWLPLKPGYEVQRHPFKLTPAQKYIAKVIHENKYVFVVKGRQTGFSTLTAAYCAWRHQKDPAVHICGASCSYTSMSDWTRRVVQFNPRIPHTWGGYNTILLRGHPWPQLGRYSLYVFRRTQL